MIDIGKDLQQAFEDGYKKGFADGQSQPTSDGWIPVSSGELPKVKEPVLITYKHNQGFIIRDVAYLSEVGEWHINTLGWLLDGGKVIAWQPLPPAYKESE